MKPEPSDADVDDRDMLLCGVWTSVTDVDDTDMLVCGVWTSVTGVDDAGVLICRVWDSFGESGDDDLAFSCWSDHDEWASSAFK